MTIGQTLALTNIILASLLTLWAAIIGAALLFSEKTRRAAGALETRPGATIGRGALVGIPAISIGLGLLNAGPPGIKALGWIALGWVAFVAFVGAAGLARLASERLNRLDSGLSGFTALWRGAGLLVLAGSIPFIGWVVLFPVQLLAALGAGLVALRRERRAPLAAQAPAAPLTEAP